MLNLFPLPFSQGGLFIAQFLLHYEEYQCDFVLNKIHSLPIWTELWPQIALNQHLLMLWLLPVYLQKYWTRCCWQNANSSPIHLLWWPKFIVCAFERSHGYKPCFAHIWSRHISEPQFSKLLNILSVSLFVWKKFTQYIWMNFWPPNCTFVHIWKSHDLDLSGWNFQKY